MIIDQVKDIRPESLLDVGCGCGHFSRELVPFCDNIIIADLSPVLLQKTKAEIGAPNTQAVCMNGLNLAFNANSIEIVMERFSLHHIDNWRRVIDEMYRVAGKYILIDEPIDDDRSQPKRDSILAWQLYLDVQKEVGYSHYRHIQAEILLDYIRQKGLAFEYDIVKSDELIAFEDFFSEFGRFAEQSKRPQQWYDRLIDFRDEISARPLCESDIIGIAIEK